MRSQVFKKKIAILLTLVFLFIFFSWEPIHAMPFFGSLGYGYDAGVFDSIYFGDLLFVCESMEYTEGETGVHFTVINAEKETYRGDFEITIYDSDNRDIFHCSPIIDLAAGETTSWIEWTEEDLSAAAAGWRILQASSVSDRNESSKVVEEHIVDEIVIVDHIELYKTDMDYWIFECDVERPLESERKILDQFELDISFHDSGGQQVLNKTVTLRMKDKTNVHMAFYTVSDLSVVDSFDGRLILPEDPASTPVVVALRNSNNLGASGRYLGKAQMGELYFQDMMITENRTLTCKVTNKGSEAKSGLFRFYFYKEKEYYATILVYAGDVILPGESKTVCTVAGGNINDADTVFIMEAQELGAERAENLPVERSQPFPEDNRMQDSQYETISYQFDAAFKFRSLKYQAGNTELSYSLHDSDLNSPFEGEIQFSFYNGDIHLATLVDNISLSDCENCKEDPDNPFGHTYERTIRTGTDLSDAIQLRVSFEGEDAMVVLNCSTNPGILSPKQFKCGIQMDDIHLYDQNGTGWFRFHFKNNGKSFERKDIIFAFVDEKGNVFSDVLFPLFFYQDREEWIESCFFMNDLRESVDLILISAEPENYDIYENYVVEVTEPAPTEQPADSPTPAPQKTPSPEETITPTIVPAIQRPIAQPSQQSAPSVQKPAGTPKPKTKVTKLIKPQIKAITKKYRKNMRIAKIRLKKYQGTYIEIYYRRGKGKFKKIKLKQCNIKKNKKLFKIGYRKGRKIIYIRVRTYQKKGGKKVYSPYSKSWRVR